MKNLLSLFAGIGTMVAWLPVQGLTPPAGLAGRSLQFNGAQYVMVGDKPQLRMNFTFTIEAWVYPTARTSQEGMILGKEGEYWLAVFPDGSLRYAINTFSEGWNWRNTGAIVPLSQWSHLALTFAGGFERTLINGVPTSGFQGSSEIFQFPGSHDFSIGGRDYNSESFAGRIVEARVWSVARTDAQIATEMHRRMSGNEPNLAGCWHLEDGAGLTANDASVNRNLGQLIGDPIWIAPSPIPPNPTVSTRFDSGYRQYIQVGAPANLVMRDYFTVEAWIFPKGPGGPENGGTIFNKEGEYQLNRFPDGRLYYAIANGSPGYAWIDTGFIAPENQWTHVTLVFQAGTTRLYANGELKFTQSGSGSIGDAVPSQNDFRIGGRTSLASHFEGNILDVRVWNVARAAGEITNNFSRTLTGKEPGLVSLWRLDESPEVRVPDSASGANNGTRIGTVFEFSWLPPAFTSRSLKFDGLDDYVRIPVFSGYYPIGTKQGLTIEAWVRPSPNPNNTILMSGNYGFNLQIQNQRLAYWDRSSWNPGSGIVADGEWQHVAVTVTPGPPGSTIQYYINGLPAGTVSSWREDIFWNTVNSFDVFGDPLVLGVQGPPGIGCGCNFFNGSMSEVRVWTKVRTAAEIQAAMMSQLAGNEANLLGYWRLDEVSGAVARDMASKAGDGALQNGLVFGGLGSVIQTNTMQLSTSNYLSLDGVDDFVRVDARPELEMGNFFTVEAWIYPTGPGNGPVGASGGIILGREGEYILARMADGSIQYAIANQTGWNWRHTGQATPLNQWTHVALTYNACTERVFLNGTPVSFVQSGGPIADTSPAQNELRIGGRQGLAQNFQGRLLEARVWNVVRSDAEIQSAAGLRLSGNEPGLAGLWHLDERSGTTAFDGSPNGLDGTTVGGPAWIAPVFVPPVASASLTFDGLDDHVSIPHGSKLNLTLGLTIEAWVKPSPKANNTILMKGNYGYNLQIQNGRLGYWDHSSWNLSSGFVANDEWQHVAVTVTPGVGGSTIQYYINGVSAGTSSSSQPSIFNNSEPLLIGAQLQVNFFSGSMAEVRLWDRARTAAEIQNTYSQPAAGTESGLVGLWRLDDGSGTTVTDSSAAPAHGTLMNGGVFTGTRTVVQTTSVTLAELVSGNFNPGTYSTLFINDPALQPALITGMKLYNVYLQARNSCATVQGGEYQMMGQSVRLSDVGCDPSAPTTFKARAELNAPLLKVSGFADVRMAAGVAPYLVGGGFSIPYTIPLGPLRLSQTRLVIDPQNQRFGGQAAVGLAIGGGGSPCPPPPGLLASSKRFGGGFFMRNGLVEEVSLLGDGLMIPLGQSSVFLDYVSATVLNPQDPGRIKVQGRMKFGAPCPKYVPTPLGPTPVFPVKIDGIAEVSGNGAVSLTGAGSVFGLPLAEVSFSYLPPNTASLGGRVDLLGLGGFVGSANISMSSAGFSGSVLGRLRVPDDVPGVGGMGFPDQKASFQNGGFSGSFTVGFGAIPAYCTPQVCGSPITVSHPCWPEVWNTCTSIWTPCTPQICTPAIPPYNLRVAYRIQGSDIRISVGKQSLTGEYEDWERPLKRASQRQDDPAEIEFFSNFRPLSKATTGRRGPSFAATGPVGQPQTRVDVPAGTAGLVINLSYEKAQATNVNLIVALPGGQQSIQLSDGPLPQGFSAVRGFGRAVLAARSATIYLQDPASGTYTITVPGSAQLGNFTVETLSEVRPPDIQILSVQETVTSGMHAVTYVIKDLETEADVSFSLDPERNGDNAFELIAFSKHNGTNTVVLDTRGADVLPGRYYLMAEVDDGYNEPVFTHSRLPVRVVDEDAPAPVTGLAVRAEDNGFTVAWDSSDRPDVFGYLVQYSTGENQSLHTFDNWEFVDAGDFSLTVTGLQNGRPYLVTVVAVDEEGFESEPVEFLRVVPRRVPGQHPPIVISRPDQDAVAGNQYIYLPRLFDADWVASAGTAQELAVATMSSSTNAPILWELVSAPQGMAIDPSGLITWTPTLQQVGEHTVKLRAIENVRFGQGTAAVTRRPDIAEQEFDVVVYEPENVAGLEARHMLITSYPPLSALEGKTYRYAVEMLAPPGDVALNLLEGPTGMTIRSNAVVWPVPTNAAGAQVRLEATTRDGQVREQAFFVDVVTEANQLDYDRPFIEEAFMTGTGFVVLFFNDAGSCQLQRTTDLARPVWVNVGGLISTEGFQTVTDPSPPATHAFYRLIKSSP